MQKELLNQPNKTIVNATIVTMNNNFDIIENGFIDIVNNKIVNIGQGLPNNNNIIDVKNSLIIPGLVNTHTHLPMTMYRGFANDLPLNTWLNNYIWPAEAKNNNPKNMAWAARLGLAEMIFTGTTTFSDMYFFTDTVANETVNAGLRGIMGESVMDMVTNNTDTAVNKAEMFFEKWHGHNLITPSLNLHSVYTCSAKVLQNALKLLKKYPMPVNIHLSETAHEVELVKKNSTLTPIEYFYGLGFFDYKIIAAHCVWPTTAELKLMKNANFSVAHCPASNLKLGSGIAPVPQMLSMGINVTIGTDGCASNNNLDMVEETRLAALLHKGFANDPTVVTDKQALAMATINGAKALGLESQIGSVEVGKKADLIIIDKQNTFMTPVFDYYAAIVYSMNSGCINTVIVDGKPVMVNRQLQTIDIKSTLELANINKPKL